MYYRLYNTFKGVLMFTFYFINEGGMPTTQKTC